MSRAPTEPPDTGTPVVDRSAGGAANGAVSTARVPRRGRPWDGLTGAIAFLTIVPVPTAPGAALDGAAVWFPLVGAGVGALAGGVRVLCGPLVGASVASVLALIALVVVTGALHQDGLADTADGLGARGVRARRLEVMRDPATGVFGALALIAWALLLVSALAALDGERALRALTVACALARWAALMHARMTPPARSDGLGMSLRISGAQLGGASALAVAAALAIGGLVPGAVALAAVVLLACASSLFARRMFGGRTGDTIGATAAVAEVLVCVVLLAVWQG